MTDRKGLVPVTEADWDAASDLYDAVLDVPSLTTIAEALALHRADALTKALRVVRELEAANNALCAKRSDATYDSMILGDGAKDELEALDEARRRARAFIAQHEGEAK